MTLKYMQGFETCRDDPDVRAQGWIVTGSPRRVAFPPGTTTLAGTGMFPIGANTSPTNTPGSATFAGVGYYNTGITINQAWTAGGFTMGFSGKFNSTIFASYGAGATNNSSQACFDGTLYWAIRLISAAFTVCTSPDLKNWTATPAQPATAMSAQSTLSYMGSGVVMVVGMAYNATLYCSYTSNTGSSWSTQSTGSATNPSYGIGFPTGNSTYPHAVMISSSNTGGLYVGSLGGTLSPITTFPAATQNVAGRPRTFGTLLVANYVGSTGAVNLAMATNSNASLNTAGAWTVGVSSVTTLGTPMDIAYSSISNLWILTTTNGIYTIPNSGVSGTPTAISGTFTATSRYTTVGMLNVSVVGSTVIATGQQGHIVTSADGGITWVESGGHIIPVGTAGTDWRCAIYDGTKYILFSDPTNGIIATTPDLQTYYQCMYGQEGAESSSYSYLNRVGVCGCSGAFGSTFTLTTNTGYGIGSGAVSGGSRIVTLYYTSTAAGTTTLTVPGTTLTHYYEMKFVKDPATVNNFFMNLYVDGTLVIANATSQPFGNSAADTTSLIIMVVTSGGQWSQYDDMYFTVDDGVAGQLQGPLGVINIVNSPPTTDVSDQWVKNGSAASNSLSVNQPALSSQSANFVSSSNSGDKDVYSSANTVPAGYTVKAVQVEGYFTKTSTTAPVANIGIVSGGAEVDSANATMSGTSAVYVSQVQSTNPNGNVAWTNTTAIAAQIALNHVT
jgi:hypothetical protein